MEQFRPLQATSGQHDFAYNRKIDDEEYAKLQNMLDAECWDASTAADHKRGHARAWADLKTSGNLASILNRLILSFSCAAEGSITDSISCAALATCGHAGAAHLHSLKLSIQYGAQVRDDPAVCEYRFNDTSLAGIQWSACMQERMA